MDTQSTPPSRGILAGLFTGIVAAVINLVYMIMYRDFANFSTAKIIMPLTIFVGFPILLAMAGYAYYLVTRHLRSGGNLFMVLCGAFLAGTVIMTLVDTSRQQGTLFSGLRGLCLGMEGITCLLAAALIPYFAKHSKLIM